MVRVDAKMSPNDGVSLSTSSTPPRKLVPDPQGHAALLIRTYGRDRALQIAQANRAVPRCDDYWADVCEALQAAVVAVALQADGFEESELLRD